MSVYRKSWGPAGLRFGTRQGYLDYIGTDVVTLVVTGTTSVAEGATTQLTATARNAAGNIIVGAPVVWSSLTPTTATVNATGLVTGVLVGGPITIRAVSGVVTTNTALTVTSVVDAYVAEFNALDVAGLSYLVLGYDTKYGPAPTLITSNTRLTALPPAYKKPGIANDMVLRIQQGAGAGPYNPLGWDNTLKEINSIGTPAGELYSVLDTALSIGQAFTIWFTASWGRSAGPTDPLALLTNSADIGVTSGTRKALLYYRNGLGGTTLWEQIFGTNGQEVANDSTEPNATDNAVRLCYYGADPGIKKGWIGVMGDTWKESYTANASYAPEDASMALWLTYFRECKIRSWWFSRGRPKPSQAQRTQLFMKTYRGIGAYSTLRRLTLLGNSYIAGTGASDQAHSFEGLVRSASTANSIRTIGVAGATFEGMEPASTEVDYTINADREFNDLLIYEGTNAYGGSADGAALYARLLTFLNNRKAAGTYRKIWVATLLPWTGSATDGNVKRDAYNVLVRNNAAAQGYLVCDWGADAIIGNPANVATYYPDGTHPNDFGHQTMKNIFTAAGGLI